MDDKSKSIIVTYEPDGSFDHARPPLVLLDPAHGAEFHMLPAPSTPNHAASANLIRATWRRCAPWCRLILTPALEMHLPDGVESGGIGQRQMLAGYYHHASRAIIVAMESLNPLPTAHHEIAHAVDFDVSLRLSRRLAAGRTIHTLDYFRQTHEIFARRYAAAATYLDEGGALALDTPELAVFGEIYGGSYARARAAKLASHRAAAALRARRQARRDRLAATLAGLVHPLRLALGSPK